MADPQHFGTRRRRRVEHKLAIIEKMHKFVSSRFEETEKDQSSLRTQAGDQRPVEGMRVFKNPVEDPVRSLTVMSNNEAPKPLGWNQWKDISEDEGFKSKSVTMKVNFEKK